MAWRECYGKLSKEGKGKGKGKGGVDITIEMASKGLKTSAAELAE